MTRPRVDVLMLKYLSPAAETAAVASILWNTNWPYHLLIQDNRDGTKNMAKLWNKFILDSNKDFVLVIDSDIEVTKGWLTSMMEVMLDETFHAGVVVPKTDNSNETIQVRPPQEDPFVYATGLVSGFCFLLRREVFHFDICGLFDEEFGFYGQDSDYFSRMGLTTDWEVVVQPKAFVKHLHNYSTRTVKSDGYDFDKDKAHALDLFRSKLKVYQDSARQAILTAQVE